MRIFKTKFNIYLAFGFAGGCIGSLFAELVEIGRITHSFIVTILIVSCWSAVSSSLITLSLVWAGEKYNRQPKFPINKIWPALWSGAIAGAVGGGVAQAVYSLHLAHSQWTHFLFQSACWGIAGALIGWRISRFIANMGKLKAFVGGFIGGFVGGSAFLIASGFASEIFGRMLGIGILGAALGLCIVAAEKFRRAASLDVLWAYNEMTTITLGEMPVTIGGGDDHIYVHGLPEHAVSVVMKNGTISCKKADTGQASVLKDGSKIQIGTIIIKVNVSK
ncbi:MAG: hypothetical protein EOM12_05635 [Verrucomicrobiae bacterium]|nr:hypothetical protein [Verrucomicrobiae bacterium]